MSEAWWALLLALFFVGAFLFNWKTGKTHLFHLGTWDRKEEPIGFWLAQGFNGLMATFCAYRLISGRW